MSETRLLFFVQLFNGFVALVFSVATARYCGPEIFGFFAITTLVLSVFLDFVDFGSVSYYSREIASKRIDLNNFVQIMNRKSIFLLAFIPFAIVIISNIRHLSFALCLFMFYPILWLRQNFLQQLLLALGKIGLAVTLQIVNRLLWLLSIPLIYLKVDLEIVYALPIILGLLLENISGVIFLSRNGVRKTILFSSKSTNVRATKNFGFLSVMSDIAMLDVLVVERIADLASASSYTFTQRLRGPLLMTFQAVNSRLRPLVAMRDRSAIIALLKYEFKFIVCGIFGIVLAALFSIIYADDLLGSEYPDINFVMAIGTLVAIPSGLVTIGSGFMASSGRDRTISRLNAIWVPTMLILVGVLTIQSGAVGAIIGLFISYLILAFFVVSISMGIWKSDFGQKFDPND